MDMILSLALLVWGFLTEAAAWVWALDLEMRLGAATLLVVVLVKLIRPDAPDDIGALIALAFRHLFRRKAKETVKVDDKGKFAAYVIASAAFSRYAKIGAVCFWGRSFKKKDLTLPGKAFVIGDRGHTLEHCHVVAVTEAIVKAIKAFNLTKGDRLLVYSDSEHAVHAHRGEIKLHANREDERLAILRAKNLADDRGVIVVVRHIHDDEQNLEKRQVSANICEGRARRVLAEFLNARKVAGQ